MSPTAHDPAPGPGLRRGEDGILRCAWAGSAPEYLGYHDEEWGRPVRGERALFERITLEAFQSGLSWLTILRKRAAFRTAFADFDPDVVAGFGAGDQARLLGDPAIVRNRAKIAATVTNARAVIALRDGEGLDALVWRHRPPQHRRPASPAELASSTVESAALARTLKAQGFVFVGPTTAYAAMQACGLVDDHLLGCHRSLG